MKVAAVFGLLAAVESVRIDQNVVEAGLLAEQEVAVQDASEVEELVMQMETMAQISHDKMEFMGNALSAANASWSYGGCEWQPQDNGYYHGDLLTRTRGMTEVACARKCCNDYRCTFYNWGASHYGSSTGQCDNNKGFRGFTPKNGPRDQAYATRKAR